MTNYILTGILSLTPIVAIPQGYSGNTYAYPSFQWSNPYQRHSTISSYNLNQPQQPFARYSHPKSFRQGTSFNRFQDVKRNSRYQQYQPAYNSYETYSSYSAPSYNNWQIQNSPSLSSNTFQPQSSYNFGNSYQDQGIVWSSQWTEWLPVSKVRWDLLRNRTYAKKVIDHIPPRTFNGQPTNEAQETYQGVAEKYYAGIFPSIEDERYT